MSDFEQLAAHILDGESNDEIAQSSDALLSDDARWLRAFQHMSEQIALPVLRNETRAALLALVKKGTPAGPSMWQRIVSSLKFDSHAGMPVAALRSGQSFARQLQYSSPALDIALDIVAEDGKATVNGQLLFNQDIDASCSIQLLQNDRDVAMTVSDAFGQFELIGLQSGYYQLVVNHADFEVLVDKLSL